MQELIKIAYGSHLYGTQTPTSDWDFKVIYLPDFNDVLLGKKHHIYKVRVNEHGDRIPDDEKMPDGGVETEYIPLQTFCRDFLGGQTYALEVAFAIDAGMGTPSDLMRSVVRQLISGFLTCNVSSMAGFAMKQTFDYVHRGVRLEKARALLRVLDDIQARHSKYLAPGQTSSLRLDTLFSNPPAVYVFDEIVERTGLETSTTVNNNRTMRTLELNGRSYLETTVVSHLQTAVQKLIDSYGDRSKDAAEKAVDPKSLMHAVRVYQQALELLTTGRMTFPRTNVEELLSIKRLETPLEETKELLLQLEHVVAFTQKTSTLLPEKNDELQNRFDGWLTDLLMELYGLNH